MKKIVILLFFAILTLRVSAQVYDNPIDSTTHYHLRMYAQSAKVPAAVLNQDKQTIDSVMYSLIVYTDTNYVYIQNDTLTIKPNAFVPDTTLKYFYAMGFADSAVGLALTQNVFKNVSNTYNNIWSANQTNPASEFTQTGDTLKVLVAGWYIIHWGLSIKGANLDAYHIVLNVGNAVQQGKGEAYIDMSGGDAKSASGSYIFYIPANTWLKLQIENTAASTTVTIIAGDLTIHKI